MSALFATLGLSEPLLRAVAEQGYASPTPIQAAAIPAALQGRDLLASAQTGSGKTAAFVLPLLEQLSRSVRRTPRRTRALVLVPTRELADQVAETVRTLAEPLAEPVKVACLFGGVSVNPQMMALRGGADVVVATPGRLLDLVERNALGLAWAGLLVLDEADRLLDAGFEDELQRVVALLPQRQQRQTLLFSATFPPAVQALARALLRDPLRIDLAVDAADPPAITQRALQVDTAQRTPLLRHLIAQGHGDRGWDRVLVFVATQYATEHVADKLRRAGIAAAALHGERSQGARRQALADFKAGRVQVLVATDVAARGIDIQRLPVVVNYDLPRSAADHVHRIGRTARAGEAGLAISFVTAATEAHFRLIEKRQGLRLTREVIGGFEPTEVPVASDPTGGIKGRRKSKKDKLREAAALAAAAASPAPAPATRARSARS
ncbi:DEAD/DEAH box helicase [Aquabacterium humicola]|uniref:DEAD/DEAH box helicase n=1 Tax=Aquabacterium humicola TaxID=3237377 RepID=UPI002542EB64|nr:DEAD/DEAH box helicase [Rubrivivax pictus]